MNFYDKKTFTDGDSFFTNDKRIIVNDVFSNKERYVSRTIAVFILFRTISRKGYFDSFDTYFLYFGT